MVETIIRFCKKKKSILLSNLEDTPVKSYLDLILTKYALIFQDKHCCDECWG